MTEPSPPPATGDHALLHQAQHAMAQGRWAASAHYFGLATQRQSHNAGAWHNLALSLLALGQPQNAIDASQRAHSLAPQLWQSHMVQGKAHKALGHMPQADASFAAVMQRDPLHGPARIARADLAMNIFGTPLQAVDWVRPLLGDPEYGEDARLTTLMASLYDRDETAEQLNAKVIAFSRQSLRLHNAPTPALARTGHTKGRPRIGLMSPLFCVSPVYFLTIANWQRLASRCEIVVFNRGHKTDWATQNFQQLAHEWHDVQEMAAPRLAQSLQDARLDVLYDLGGWMDPVGLKALSVKPARQMFKWVGGQSITTGLDCFDGWIGDDAQSPRHLSHLYTEPLINIPSGYAQYTPPAYMPQPSGRRRRQEPVIFSNPAKLSRAFLLKLNAQPGRKVFVHQQFKYPQARAHVLAHLDAGEVEFITPSSHKEALLELSRYSLMLDTFPYSSGLTAREATALGVRVEAHVGTLFCERHCASLAMA